MTVGLAALIDPAPPGPERLPMLGVLLRQVARRLATGISQVTGDAAEVALGRMTGCRFGAFCEEVAAPAVYGIGRIDNGAGRLLLRIDTGLLRTAVHAMIGGMRDRVPTDAGAAPSAVELGFATRLSTLALQELEAAFATLAPLACRHERVERDLRFAAIVPPETPVIVADFAMTLMGRGGTLALMLPLPALEPLRPLLASHSTGGRSPHDAQWQGRLDSAVAAIPIDVEVEVAEVAASFADLAALSPGALLPLGWDGSAVRLAAGHRTLCAATLFHADRRYALTLGTKEAS